MSIKSIGNIVLPSCSFLENASFASALVSKDSIVVTPFPECK
jgi:hypothetical protein